MHLGETERKQASFYRCSGESEVNKLTTDTSIRRRFVEFRSAVSAQIAPDQFYNHRDHQYLWNSHPVLLQTFLNTGHNELDDLAPRPLGSRVS